MLKLEKYDKLYNKIYNQIKIQVDSKLSVKLTEEVINGFEVLLNAAHPFGDKYLACMHVCGRITNNKLMIRYLCTDSNFERYLNRNELKLVKDFVWSEYVCFDVNGFRINCTDLRRIDNGQTEKNNKETG